MSAFGVTNTTSTPPASSALSLGRVTPASDQIKYKSAGTQNVQRKRTFSSSSSSYSSTTAGGTNSGSLKRRSLSTNNNESAFISFSSSSTSLKQLLNGTSTSSNQETSIVGNSLDEHWRHRNGIRNRTMLLSQSTLLSRLQSPSSVNNRSQNSSKQKRRLHI